MGTVHNRRLHVVCTMCLLVAAGQGLASCTSAPTASNGGSTALRPGAPDSAISTEPKPPREETARPDSGQLIASVDASVGCCDETPADGGAPGVIDSDAGVGKGTTDAAIPSPDDAGMPEIDIPTYVPDCPFDCSGEIVIPDANLDYVVRYLAKKPAGALFAADVANISKLDLEPIWRCGDGGDWCDDTPPEDVKDLTGIQCLLGLKELHVDAQPKRIPGICPIAYLQGLDFLSVSGVGNVDLGPISVLTQLKTLYLPQDVELEDIQVIGALRSLENLAAVRNNISDISVLSHLNALRVISLYENKISDISLLAGLANLEHVFLNSNLVRDLAAFVENPGIGEGDRVNVSSNPIPCTMEQFEYARALTSRGVNLVWDCRTGAGQGN